MSKSQPSPPPQPNPQVVGAAQTSSNVNTAVANTVMGNANQYGPYGSTEFEQIGSYGIPDGNGGTIMVPQYNQNTVLAPAQQHLLDQQNTLGSGLNQLAIDQTGRISNLLGQPIQAPGGSLQSSFGQEYRIPSNPEDAPQWVKDYLGTNNVRADILSRVNPEIDRQTAQLDTKLANEGFVRGTEAYNQAMDEARRQANDAYIQADLASGQEQSRRANLLLSGQSQAMSQAQAMGMFNNQAYAQQLQTDLALRNQPINEISALRSGGQVTLPQFQGYQAGTVQGTPIGDYYMQNAQMANQNYQAQLQANAQQQAGLYGGIGSLVGAGLYGGLKYSDRRVKRDVTRVGTWLNGLPVYLFRYLWSPFFHIGFMAQDVELVRPEAVATIGDIKCVNYALAVK